jgi:prefoldin subunit 5
MPGGADDSTGAAASAAPPPPPSSSAAQHLLDPKAAFIEDVPAYLSQRKLEPEAAILELQERLRRLRALEGQVAQRRARTLAKAPEIEAALAAVKGLAARRATGTDPSKSAENPTTETSSAAQTHYVDYALSDGVFARAALKGNVPAVGLWLGAGVMVEYPLDEALLLLESNLKAAKEGLEALGRDLDLVKDGATVTEVSIARVFNYDVERRGGGGGGG